MSKKQRKKSSKFKDAASFAARWSAAWAIGLAILAYTLAVGLPVWAVRKFVEALGENLTKGAEALYRLNLQVARPANWALEKALKIHPKGKKIKRSL